jgi:hypothetical protein
LVFREFIEYSCAVVLLGVIWLYIVSSAGFYCVRVGCS